MKPFHHLAWAGRSTAFALFSAVMALLAGQAVASCGDRPGTPNNPRAVATSASAITFHWRNTTGKGMNPSGSVGIGDQPHSSYFDISVTDPAGNNVGKDHGATERFGNLVYGSESSMNFTGLAPNTTYCFKIRARTAGRNQGCVSAIFSGTVCATTPSPEQDAACSAFTKTTLKQAERIRYMQQAGECKADPNAGRWSGFADHHYGWCVEQIRRGNNAALGSEVGERERILTKVCKPLPPRQSPSPPHSSETPAGFECRFGVAMTLADCTNASDGSEVKNWDYKGLSPVCGLGKDEDDATQSAIDAYLRIGVTVREQPGWGECGFTHRPIPYCSCDTAFALSTRSYNGKVEPPLKSPLDVMKSPFNRCFSNMVHNAEGKCTCPRGMRWRGVRCETSAVIPVPPYGSSDGGLVVKKAPSVTGIRRCRWPRPVGRPPYCCPYGTRYERGACRRPSAPVLTTKPDGAPIPGTNPRLCPPGRPIGRPPYCCPVGMRYAGGVCRRTTPMPLPGGGAGGVEVKPPRLCPPGRPVGRPPYCCPLGTQYVGGVCRRASPTQSPAGGAGTSGSKSAICPPGRPVGKPPYCCPRGTQYLRGACRA